MDTSDGPWHFDFSGWSDADWRALDIPALVMQAAPQFCARIHPMYPGADRADVLQEYYAQTLPRLERAHQRHLDARGTDRTRAVVGTLHAVADQMARGGARRLRLEDAGTQSYDPALDDRHEWAAAAEHWQPDHVPEPADPDELASLRRLERVRHHLTARQYEILYRRVALREPPNVTAEYYGVTHQAISRITSQARRRLEALLPGPADDASGDAAAA